MLSRGYVKYEEAEVHRSAIMQDFRDNKKKLERCKDAGVDDYATADSGQRDRRTHRQTDRRADRQTD